MTWRDQSTPEQRRGDVPNFYVDFLAHTLEEEIENDGWLPRWQTSPESTYRLLTAGGIGDPTLDDDQGMKVIDRD